jgi:hypothetical protein
MGQNEIGRHILNEMEEIPIFSVSMTSITQTRSTQVETLIQTFEELRKLKISILWFPDVDEWIQHTDETTKSTLIQLIKDIPSTLKVFILATSQTLKSEYIDDEIINLFEYDYEIKDLNDNDKNSMFKNLYNDLIIFSKLKKIEKNKKLNESKNKEKESNVVVEKVNNIIIEEGIMTESEERLIKKDEEKHLRVLRIRLYDCLTSLLSSKKFECFSKPSRETSKVDLIYIYDILDRLKNKYYTETNKFLDDFKRIVDDSKYYSPSEQNENDIFFVKKINSRALYLFECAHSFVDDIPKSLKKTCKNITQRRKDYELKKLSILSNQFNNDDIKFIENNNEKIDENIKNDNEKNINNENDNINDNEKVKNNDENINEKIKNNDENINDEKIKNKEENNDEKVKNYKEDKKDHNIEEENKKEEKIDEINIENNQILENNDKINEIFDENEFLEIKNIFDDLIKRFLIESSNFNVKKIERFYCNIYSIIFKFCDNKDDLINEIQNVII